VCLLVVGSCVRMWHLATDAVMPLVVSGAFRLILVAFDFINQNYSAAPWPRWLGVFGCGGLSDLAASKWVNMCALHLGDSCNMYSGGRSRVTSLEILPKWVKERSLSVFWDVCTRIMHATNVVFGLTVWFWAWQDGRLRLYLLNHLVGLSLFISLMELFPAPLILVNFRVSTAGRHISVFRFITNSLGYLPINLTEKSATADCPISTKQFRASFLNLFCIDNVSATAQLNKESHRCHHERSAEGIVSCESYDMY